MKFNRNIIGLWLILMFSFMCFADRTLGPKKTSCPRTEARKCPTIEYLFRCLGECSTRNEARKYLAGFLMDMHCPDIQFICPTKNKQHFVAHSSFHWNSFQCKFIGKIVDRALEKCHSDVMDNCKKGWKNRADGCSIPVDGVKEFIDTVFCGVCDLHDLCYSSTDAIKDDCDNWFLHNMLQICKHKGLFYTLSDSECAATASSMYTTMKTDPDGESSFIQGQAWVFLCHSESFKPHLVAEAEWGV